MPISSDPHCGTGDGSPQIEHPSSGVPSADEPLDGFDPGRNLQGHVGDNAYGFCIQETGPLRYHDYVGLPITGIHLSEVIQQRGLAGSGNALDDGCLPFRSSVTNGLDNAPQTCGLVVAADEYRRRRPITGLAERLHGRIGFVNGVHGTLDLPLFTAPDLESRGYPADHDRAAPALVRATKTGGYGRPRRRSGRALVDLVRRRAHLLFVAG